MIRKKRGLLFIVLFLFFLVISSWEVYAATYCSSICCSAHSTCTSLPTGLSCDGTKVINVVNWGTWPCTNCNGATCGGNECQATKGALVEDCATKASTNSDGGNFPATYGTCSDYSTCSAGTCPVTTRYDTCTSTTALTEYYASGASCPSTGYTCTGRFVAASDTDGGNVPTSNGVCTGGTGAQCSSGQFNTYAGSSGTDACTGTCGTGTNSCQYREYYPASAGYACAGSDTCTSTLYNADTNSNTCTTCGETWSFSGEIFSTTCCGDDSSEYIITENSATDAPAGYGDGTTTCCSATTDCNYNQACSTTGTASSAAIPSKAYCSSAIWYGGDSSSTACTYVVGGGNWNLGGEVSPTACCGDDSNEYYKNCVDSSAQSGATCGADTVGCCSSTTSCIDEIGGCRATGTCLGAPGSSVFGGSYCNSGTWEDPDESSSYCTAFCDYTTFGADDGIAYVSAAYNQGDYGNPNCCGDDADEYYIASGILGPFWACCDTSTDCVSNGGCYASGALTISSDYYCNSGSWVQCTSGNAGAVYGSYFCDGSQSTWRPIADCTAAAGGDDTDASGTCEVNYCSAPSICDESAVGGAVASCTGGTYTYLRDVCGSSSSCVLADQNVCGSTAYQASCTGHANCNGQAPYYKSSGSGWCYGTGGCTSWCTSPNFIADVNDDSTLGNVGDNCDVSGGAACSNNGGVKCDTNFDGTAEGRCSDNDGNCCTANYVDANNDGQPLGNIDSCAALSSSYNGYRCSLTSADIVAGTWDGVVVWSGSAWVCDTDTVFYDGSLYYYGWGIAGFTDGRKCENGAIGSDGFTQEGYGVGTTCDTSAPIAKNNGGTYYVDCVSSPGSGCDNTPTSAATWSQDGTCLTADTCQTSENVCLNGATYYGGTATNLCSASCLPANSCDNALTNGDYSATGVCRAASSLCCTDYTADADGTLDAASTCGTQAVSCAAGNNGYYCDYVADGAWAPTVYRCDGSDTACRACNFGTLQDSETLCESGCTANANCDEREAYARVASTGWCYGTGGCGSWCTTSIYDADNNGQAAGTSADGCGCTTAGRVCDTTFSTSSGNGRCSGTTCCTTNYVDANNNGLYDDAVCTCDSPYSGYKCASTGTTWNGVCAYTGAAWICDTDTVFYGAGVYYATGLGITYGNKCEDGAIGSDGFQQEGYGVGTTCDTSAPIAKNNGGTYYVDCVSSPGSGCDNTPTSAATWSQEGICETDNTCTTSGYSCYDASRVEYYENGCGNPCIDAEYCDNTLTNGDFYPFTGGGVCTTATCCSYWALGATNSPTSCGGSNDGGSAICTGNNGKYCDYVGDGSWSATNNRCDGSDAGNGIACVVCSGNIEGSRGSISDWEAGDGQCEDACGASSSCDEVSASTCPTSTTFCGSTCAYVSDMDTDQTACIATGSGCTGYNWNIGGEVVDQALCCGNDAGENAIPCSKSGVTEDLCNGGFDNLACCSAATSCVYKGTCYATGAYNPDYPCAACSSGNWVYRAASTTGAEIGTCKQCSGSSGTPQNVDSVSGYNCNTDCTSCVTGSCNTRASLDNTEVSTTCYYCNGAATTSQPYTGETGVSCTTDCYDCSAGTCTPTTEPNDGGCNLDCNSCVTGSCNTRASLDNTEVATTCYYCNGAATTSQPYTGATGVSCSSTSTYCCLGTCTDPSPNPSEYSNSCGSGDCSGTWTCSGTSGVCSTNGGGCDYCTNDGQYDASCDSIGTCGSGTLISNCAACTLCTDNGATVSCPPTTVNTQDTISPNTCSSTCVKCNGAGACVNELSSEDLFNQCSPSWTSCDSVCVKRGPNGNCNGVSGACDTNSATSYMTVAGDVCSSGNEVAASASPNCDTTINCATGACSAARYYRGCAIGSSSCTETSKVAYASWNAGVDTATSETNYKVGTTCTTSSTYCNVAWTCTSLQTTDNSYNNAGNPYETQGYCDGGGSCDKSGSTRDNDAASSACECYASSTQGNCDAAGEVGCWYAGGSQCCGDDGAADDFCTGGYTGCLDGTWRTDADTYSYVCTSCGGSQYAIGGEVAATACCGDDAGENAKSCTDSSAQGACGADTIACCNTNTKCVDDAGTCRATGACYGSGVFGNSYCNSNSWEDPDENSGYCLASCDVTIGDNGIGYALGGEVAAANCCGDDNSEFKVVEASSTDAPAGYNDAITTCCDTNTDCTYDDTCTASTGVSAPAVPNKAYCNSGTWYGGDASSAACTAIIGAGRWYAGGTKCCGDDSSETWNADASFGCCCGSTVIGNPNDDYCATSNQFCLDGTYCATITRDPSQTSGTTLSGDDLVCGCDSSSVICDGADANSAAEGVCASSTCATGMVANNGGSYTTTCSNSLPCDSNVNSGGSPPQWVQDATCVSTSCCTGNIISGETASATWDGDEICGACSVTYNGQICATSGITGWNGVCARDNVGSWTCDTNTVFWDGSSYWQVRASSVATDGKACEDGAVGSDGFTQEGYGLTDGTCDTVGVTAENCDSDANAACAGTESFYNTCDARTTYADSCDSSLTSGTTWSQVGTCINNGLAFPSDNSAYCDNTYETAKVGTTYYNDCADAGAADGSGCDSSAATGGDYSPDGVCTDDLAASAADCCTGIASKTGSDYICGCTVSDHECDSDVDASGYVATGSCQVPTCCASVTGPRQNGQSCDQNADCAIYNSGDTCYYSGDCTSGCACTFTTDTTCPIATGSCTYGGCNSNYCLDDPNNVCYYTASTCGGSGWTDKSSTNCYDPGQVVSGSCYYDNGGALLRSNDCTVTGCSGVSSQSTPYACTSGSFTDGAMACWNGFNCYSASSDGCQADTNGWDYSTGTTQCTASYGTCCPTQGTIAEGVACTSAGPQASVGSPYDRDSSSTRCTSVAYGCTAYTWMTTAAKCCGDDGGATDTYNSDSTQGCCCNGGLISTGNDDYCGTNNQFCLDGTYCATITRDPSHMSGTTLDGDDLVCGCDNSGVICDGADANGAAEGVCASSTCATGMVAKNGGSYTTTCSNSLPCDSNVNSGGTTPTWVQDGSCISTSCCTTNIISGEPAGTSSVWNGNEVCAACAVGYNGQGCDTNADGTFDGACAYNGATWTCDTDAVFFDGTNYRQTGSSPTTDGYKCDADVAGSGFQQDGLGVNTACQTSGHVVCPNNEGNTCYSACAALRTGQKCDDSAVSLVWTAPSGDFFGKGVCAYNGASWICDTTNPTSTCDDGATHKYTCDVNGCVCDSAVANSDANYVSDGRCYGTTSCCTADYVDGNNNATFDDSVCGCTASQSGYRCSLTSANVVAGSWTGICQYTEGSVWDCVVNTCPTLQVGGQFQLKDTSNANLMVVDGAGNIAVKGRITTICSATPTTEKYWAVQKAGAFKAWLDSATGNLCLTGRIYQGQGTLAPSGGDDYIIKDAANTTFLAYVDGATGDLYAKATVGALCTI